MRRFFNMNKFQYLISFALLFSFKIVYAQELFRYTCQVDRVQIEEFESSRTFDRNGIILSDKKYHPLSIAKYGLFAYYKFKETADSTYYLKCVNQVNYFKNPSQVHELFEGKGIGLPYNFKFWDLKAPWYSGMTQGFAISYLLRYYKLTSDTTILPVIEKIAYVLTAPLEKGGTISTTSEGCTWIEEYPNSKKSKQVLNGFINGLIGLYEYCTFFPGDTVANQIFTQSYECLISSLEHFDTPSWSYYDRNRKTLADNYMWYQIYEMKHLHEIFQEPVFDYQMRIWSVMLANKLSNQKKRKVEFVNRYKSQQAEKMNDSLFFIPMTIEQTLSTDSLQVLSLKSNKEYRRFFKNKKRKTKTQSKLSYFLFQPTQTDSADYLKITFNDSVLTPYEISLFKKLSHKPKKNTEIKTVKYFNGNQLHLTFPKMNISEITLKIEDEHQFNLSVSDIGFYDSTRGDMPFFSHQIFPHMKMEKGIEYEITLPAINTSNAIIFYKNAPSVKSLNTSKWKAINTINPNSIFTPSHDGFYSFMIVYDLNNPLSFIGNLEITPVTFVDESLTETLNKR
jgi:heparosan-N-sulfate-glucuronate 5-epimerase